MDPYVTGTVLKTQAVAEEADTDAVFDQLAAAVSRMFDKECEVPDGFFLAADISPVARTVRGNNTQYIRIGPYVLDSITDIAWDGSAIELAGDAYYEQEGYLVFTSRVLSTSSIVVTARFGFAEISADIIQACIEQGLFQWRRKDLAFAELSGVSAGAINAQFSPTFEAVAKRYRDRYSTNNYFV